MTRCDAAALVIFLSFGLMEGHAEYAGAGWLIQGNGDVLLYIQYHNGTMSSEIECVVIALAWLRCGMETSITESQHTIALLTRGR